TLDCAACILTPKMVSAGQHPNIDIRSFAEVSEVAGHVGQFEVKIKRNKRYVDDKKCNGCGLCYQECPAVVSPSDRKVSVEGKPYFVGSFADGGEAKKVTIKQGDRERKKPIKDTPTGDCIFCGKCANICSELVGANAIVLHRDENAETGKQRSLEFTGDCIGCGACVGECPTGALDITDAKGRQVLHHEMMLGPNKAIRVPTLQAVPNVPFIDEDACIFFKNGGCKKCAEVCPQEAVSHDMQEVEEEVEVGSILVATGYDTIDLAPMLQYGWGRYDNVISGLEFEILCHASGTTGGKIVKADGTAPKSVAILHCIGSRDEHYHEHCSRVCCMYSLKFAHLVREKVDCDVYEFYIDIRAAGKGYEEFYKRLMREDVTFIRGKAAEITNWPMTPDEEGKLIVKAEDTLMGQLRRVPVDMVILSPALQSRDGAQVLAQTLGIGCGSEGFYLERHPKLAPVQTAADGVFVAGACQGPKDIPDSVAQGAAAAANILSLIDKGTFSIEPVTAVIDEELCGGCRTCINMCPYSALSADEEKNVAVCESALCKGCGTCVAACPAGAIQQQGYTDEQIWAELEGALRDLPTPSAE
ncbi:MAG: 4Fe-4S dicluster domain-containing protein, partial [Armatimonadia bacterium]|nr:4Fe-4S dicluster domain-containing protein [Armatimonadia bacterium]